MKGIQMLANKQLNRQTKNIFRLLCTVEYENVRPLLKCFYFVFYLNYYIILSHKK